MEAIFTLSYPEYTVAMHLQQYFKKSEGYSVSIPLSRQQKGFDLLMYNLKTKRAVSLQVKSSRIWSTKKPDEDFQYSAWFNRFQINDNVDFYVFFILYPINALDKKRLGKENPNKWWRSRIVLLDNAEISALFRELKTKKGEPERFFYFGFNEVPLDIFITRGLPQIKSLKENLLEFQIKKLKGSLE